MTDYGRWQPGQALPPGRMIAGDAYSWAARRFKNHETLVFEDRRITYQDLDRRANKLANALRGLGLHPGDRVAVLVSNSVESVETIVGLSKAALAYIALNARQAAEEHADVLNDSETSAIIASAEFAEIATEIAEMAPSVRFVIGVGWKENSVSEYEALLERAADSDPAIVVDATDYTRIQYTSGTTGKPKGLAYSFQQMEERQRNFFGSLEYAVGPAQSMAHVGPMTHAPANYFYPYHRRGARNVILPRFDPEQLFWTVERERITHLLMVPTMLIRVLDYLDVTSDKFDMSSLSIINYGTAPTPAELVRRGIERFGPIFRQHYGMTEASQPLTVLYPYEHDLSVPGNAERLASCGRPVLGVNITVRGDDDNALPPGEVGEIALEAKGVAAVEYWRRPDLAAETIRDGWFYSGDLGRFDEDGYLFIVGRSKDMIISGGFNIYAREVEEAVHRHAQVSEVAVIGVPDREWGEIVVAYVVPRDGERPQSQDLIAECVKHVASYKKPRVIEFIDELPKNHAGKILKEKLRERYFEEHEQVAQEGVLARY